MAFKVLSLSYWYVILYLHWIQLSKRFVWVRKRGVMFMCVNVYDVALCRNTVRNVALGLWLVGHCWFTTSAIWCL